jgi:hypothetical protein
MSEGKFSQPRPHRDEERQIEESFRQLTEDRNRRRKRTYNVEEDIQKTVRLMQILRKLRLASVLTSVSGLSLTEAEFKQHKLLKKRNAFNICCVNEAREVLNNARVVGEDGDIQCPTLLFSSNGQDQEQDWVLNQQKFAEIMGAKLISYDCGHYIHHFKSDEMCKEITEFVQSL